MQYPENELALKNDIDLLMEEWRTSSSETITTDGFYPCYLSRSPKILFLARESRGLEGCDYIQCVHDGYRRRDIGGCPIT